MKVLFLILSVFNFANCDRASTSVKERDKTPILVFYKTAAFYHTSIPVALSAFQKLGDDNNFVVDTTSNAAFFTDKQLEKYKAVVFLCTTGNVLNKEEEDAFQRFIRKGGGFMGVHSATDTEYEWSWYNSLAGAYFLNHPAIQTATINVVDSTHAATAVLPPKWTRRDEWYSFKNIQPHINVLAYLDESSYKGGANGTKHPLIWYHYFEGGRAFYTALGHTPESYSEPLFLQHLLGGLKFAAGL
jgi:uncharacterized protein